MIVSVNQFLNIDILGRLSLKIDINKDRHSKHLYLKVDVQRQMS